MPRSTDSSLSLFPIADAPRFRYISQQVEEGLFEVRLVAEGEKIQPPIDVEISVERLTWIPREFIESMGGEVPYDRFELRWPLERDDTSTLTLALQTAQDEAADQRGADSLYFPLPEPLEWPTIDAHETHRGNGFFADEHKTVTTFEVWEDGVSCRVGNSKFRFHAAQVGFLRQPTSDEEQGATFQLCSLQEFQVALEKRNAALGLNNQELPKLLPRLQRRQNSFPVHTGEEWTAFIQSAADGKRLSHFSGNEQNGILRHQRPNTAFYTETTLLEEERQAGHGIELLRNAAAQLDIDDGLAWLYISHLLAPPSPLAANSYAGGWVDLDDVARKTMGGYARNPEEARARRHKVWRAICYGARAHIGGQRSVPYFDKASGKVIDTEIYTAPWQIVARQKASQLPLFATGEENVPVRVELVASREWTALTTEASTAQYLPFGEILGALPAERAGGSWGRVLGLAYINWSRRRVTQALEGADLPSRREMLDAFPSKIAPYLDILNSKNPQRALLYWRDAEELLCEAQIIETEVTLYQPKTRKGWSQLWLDEVPEWKPGALLRPILEELQKKRFVPTPKSLKKPVRIRRKKRDLLPPE